MRHTGNDKGLEGRLFDAFIKAGAILALSIALGILVNQTRTDGLPLISWHDPFSEQTPTAAGAKPIPFEEAEGLFPYHQALFLDARLPEVYAQSHIAGAANLPSERFEEYSGTVLGKISKGTLIIVYCDGEMSTLSWHLAQQLASKGYVNLRVLTNGWNLWLSKQLPIEAAEPEARSMETRHA
jgi:rhodanese-related sulfurtransferase